MKKTLCILLAAAALLAGVQANAQMSAGAGYLNLTRTTASGSNSTSVNGNGAYAGLSFNIPLAGGLGIAPGIYYSLSTFKTAAAVGTIVSTSGTTVEHAINVPLNLNFGYNLARDMRAFIFAGPTFQYGLSSKTSTEGKLFGLSGSTVTDNYANTNNQRFAVYIGGGLGMDIAGNFQITVGYDHSLTNFVKSDNVKVSRGGIKIGAAMLF